MEDRVHIEHVRPDDGSAEYTYLAVYDGHGGADASEYVRENLLRNIRKQDGFNKGDHQMLDAIKKGFVETHYAMLNVVGALFELLSSLLMLLEGFYVNDCLCCISKCRERWDVCLILKDGQVESLCEDIRKSG